MKIFIHQRKLVAENLTKRLTNNKKDEKTVFLSPRIYVTHFASQGVPLDAPGYNTRHNNSMTSSKHLFRRNMQEANISRRNDKRRRSPAADRRRKEEKKDRLLRRGRLHGSAVQSR